MKKEDIQKDQQTWDYIKKVWEEPFGDRRQELVFIGTNYDKEEMIKNLDKALLTDDEMKLSIDEWSEFEDPFPQWQIAQENEEDAEQRHQEELEAIQEEKDKLSK